MMAPDGDGRGQLAACDEIVQRNAELRAIALAQPADPGGQALKMNACARKSDPALQMIVVRKELEHQLVGPRDVHGIARQRDPSEWALSFTEQRADVFRNEAGYLERVAHPGVERDRPDIVAVVEG